MQAEAPSQGLVDACGEKPSAVCEWVWDQTGKGVLASLADWVIGRPLAVAAILLVAWIVALITRRLARRAVLRFMTADQSAARALEKAGVASAAVKVEDPRRSARANSVATVVTSTISVLIWVIAVLLSLGQLGINLAPLIAGAGVAGIAIGFGAQNLVKDCVAGFFMLVEDQYGIGDVVDLGVASGSVERISLRTTILRSQDGTVWHVPNGEVRRVGNRSQLWSVAVLDVVVAYDADLAETRRVLHDVAEQVCAEEHYASDVLAAPELLGVEGAGLDGVTLRLLVKTNPGAQYRVQRALREQVKLAIDAAGIEVRPPPGRTAEETDSDTSVP
jgi:moderate conductance mechanosensitive channel